MYELDGEGPWSALIPLLELRHVRIAEAHADAHGRLFLGLADSSSLTAGTDPSYENWEVSGPGPLILASPPGGGDPRLVWPKPDGP